MREDACQPADENLFPRNDLLQLKNTLGELEVGGFGQNDFGGSFEVCIWHSGMVHAAYFHKDS